MNSDCCNAEIIETEHYIGSKKLRSDYECSKCHKDWYPPRTVKTGDKVGDLVACVGKKECDCDCHFGREGHENGCPYCKFPELNPKVEPDHLRDVTKQDWREQLKEKWLKSSGITTVDFMIREFESLLSTHNQQVIENEMENFYVTWDISKDDSWVVQFMTKANDGKLTLVGQIDKNTPNGGYFRLDKFLADVKAQELVEGTN